MYSSLWLTPGFLISAVVTLAAGCYSYIYLPIQMRRAYRQSLLTLAQAVETKDTGALGHGERVADLVTAVAKEMHVPRRERRQMMYAAFLQDIGNVRVPSAVLNKTDRLTFTEFNMVKVHTDTGADMVAQVRFLRDVAPIIRYHHEAWDGNGYPKGLEGQEIPLGSRILAVCTAYDSMVHAKSYRARMSGEEATSMIRVLSGTKYDPEVVNIFLSVLKK